MKPYNTPISEKIKELKKEGFTKEFRFSHNHLVEERSHAIYLSSQIKTIKEYRIENKENPYDDFFIYAVHCKDGTKGTLFNLHCREEDEYLDD
ncbi:hypothetical protein, partial [Xanthovirga aplysinae]|uniref:hypothetical protein n=1 Tax=Xanthovirga aplysinae TaxID=2529853 RepID=UPI0012BC384A